MSDWDAKVQLYANKICEGDEGRRTVLGLQTSKQENRVCVQFPGLSEAPDKTPRNLFVPLPPLCNVRISPLPNANLLFMVSA